MIRNGSKIYTFNTPKIVSGPTGKIYHGAAGFQYETDAIYDRGRSEGFNLPDIQNKRRNDVLLKNLMYTSLWAKLDYFECMCYNSTVLNNFKRINWKNPSGNLATINGGVVYDAYGWQGTGVNAYIDTGFNPAVNGANYSLNNAGRGAVIYVASTSTSSVIDGNTSGTNGMVNGNASGHRINSINAASTGVNLAGNGFTYIGRTSATALMFVKSATQITATQTSTVLPNENQWILRSGSSYSNAGISFYFIVSSLTFAETQLMRAAINNYITSLGLPAIA